MNSKPNRRFLPLVLKGLILLLGIPSCVCQNDDQNYQTCRQPFQCGRLGRIGYPFWGRTRPASCGYPGFKLICEPNGYPLLNISSMTYRVLRIDSTAQTLRVSRNDLFDNFCPTPLSNTTLNFTIFDYDQSANDQNITLYYGCNLTQQWPEFLAPNYQMNCSASSQNGSNFYAANEVSQQFNAFGSPCDNRIYVPVNQSAARDLQNPVVASMDLLRTSLQSGFSIQYFVDNHNCRDCTRSGGLCGYNENTTSFVCYGVANGSGSKMPVIMGVSVGIAGLIILSIIIYCIRKHCRVHHHSQESDRNVDKFLLTHGSLAPKRYSYSEIKKMTKSFTDKLGQGGYGTVYKGNLPDGEPVAVKVLSKGSDNAEEFINEVASISRTSHVNIVNLLGFCYDKKKRALVYEFMPNKSLDRFIYKHGSAGQECSLEWEKTYGIAVGVARGLEYLHRGCNTRIVHFDIKPQNILLDEKFSPKISDFGLARLFKKQQSILSTFGPRGTIGYIAPEVFFRSFGVVSHKSDVYSYGMTLLEMSEARKIVETEAIQSSENYFPDKIYEYAMLGNDRLEDAMAEEKEVVKRKMLLVGLWCIQPAPSDRPSMTKVVEMLEGNLQSIQVPPKPLLFPPTPSLPRCSFLSL